MTTAPETRITQRIIKALRARGTWVVKYSGGMYSTDGIPDLIACDDGGFVAIEVKRPLGQGNHKTSKLQAHTIRKIREAGGRAGVACNVEEAIAVMNGEYIECQREHEVDPCYNG